MNYKKFNEEVLNSDVNGSLTLATAGGHELQFDIQNSTGYDQEISTLAKVKAEIVDEVVNGETLSDFARITSEAGWADSLVYFTEETVGDEDGLSSADGVNGQGDDVNFSKNKKTVLIEEWKKGYDVSKTEMMQVSMTGNRSAIVSKDRALERAKKVWMQRKFFIGGAGSLGLLNMSGVSVDATTLTKDISLQTQAELETQFASMYKAFRENNNYTAHADRLFMPADQLVELGRIYSEYNIATVVELVEKSFKAMSGNANFKIVSSIYGTSTNSPQSANTYMLYNSQVVFADAPVEMEAIYTKGLDIRSDKLMRMSEVYIERPQEALIFTPAA